MTKEFGGLKKGHEKMRDNSCDIFWIAWVMLVMVILHGRSRNNYISICYPLILCPLNGLDKYFYNWLRRKDILVVVGVRSVMQV